MTNPAFEPRRITEPAALKALAHPLRLRILAELEDRGRATATQLAAALGESSGATSYHLRQLHKHGFVEEDPGRGAGRERYWRPAAGGWHLPVLEFANDEIRSTAADLVLRAHLAADVDRALKVVHDAQSWPAPWRSVLRRTEVHLDLDAGQAAALNDELDRVIDRFRAETPGTDARRVVLLMSTTPTEHPALTGNGEGAAR